MERNYYTMMVYKNSRRRKIIDQMLTRDEAMKLVAEDIRINPEAKEKMLIFNQSNK